MADSFRQKLQHEKKAVVEIAALAAEVRNQHLAKKGGKYDADFTKWWKDNDINSVFGTLSTFTTYAKAGDAVGRLRRNLKAKLTRCQPQKLR